VYLIGTDEAGYGPNLGPLVVAASVWETEPPALGERMYERLDGVVCAAPTASNSDSQAPLAIADSKRVYQSGKGLAPLERSLWPVMGLLDLWPDSWSEVWHALAPDSVAEMRRLPWYAHYDARAPVSARLDELHALSQRLRRQCERSEVHLVELRARAIFADEFNTLLDRFASKGAALTHATLEVLGRVLGGLGPGRASVWCDKHGGRNRYAGLLAQHFPGVLVETREEGRSRSVYRLSVDGRRVEVVFAAQGETQLPVALASMAAKYLRELAMRALNEFWCDQVPGLAPTAGYPLDARRFRAAIAQAQERLGIDQRVLWRAK